LNSTYTFPLRFYNDSGATQSFDGDSLYYSDGGYYYYRIDDNGYVIGSFDCGGEN